MRGDVLVHDGEIFLSQGLWIETASPQYTPVLCAYPSALYQSPVGFVLPHVPTVMDLPSATVNPPIFKGEPL